MPNLFRRAFLISVLCLVLLGAQNLMGSSSARAQDDLPRGDFRLVLREDFIIEQLETQLFPYVSSITANGITIEDPAIDFRADNIIDVSAQTQLPLAGQTMDVRPTISIAVSAEENQLTFAIDTITLEGVRLPAALLQSQLQPVQETAQTQINALLEQVERLAGLELVYLETTEDLLILDFNFDLLFFTEEPQL